MHSPSDRCNCETGSLDSNNYATNGTYQVAVVEEDVRIAETREEFLLRLTFLGQVVAVADAQPLEDLGTVRTEEAPPDLIGVSGHPERCSGGCQPARVTRGGQGGDVG